MPAPPAPIALHAETHGPATGRPILFVHGFPFDRRMWQGQVEPLTKAGYRVVVPDLRGFGKSPAAEPATMDAMARDLAHLIEGMGGKKPVVCGFSMGGYAVLQLALRDRDLIAGIVLVDTRAEADSDSAKAGRLTTIAAVQAQGVEALVASMMPKLVSNRTRESRPATVKALEALMRDQKPAACIAAVRGMMDRPDMRGKLSGMNIPCLVVAGLEDAIIPADDQMRLSQAFRGSQFEGIEGAGHATPVERPDAFNQVLLEWLKQGRF